MSDIFFSLYVPDALLFSFYRNDIKSQCYYFVNYKITVQQFLYSFVSSVSLGDLLFGSRLNDSSYWHAFQRPAECRNQHASQIYDFIFIIYFLFTMTCVQ